MREFMTASPQIAEESVEGYGYDLARTATMDAGTWFRGQQVEKGKWAAESSACQSILFAFPAAHGASAAQFTGYFRDAETQLDYAVNRYHQPGMGRFLTPDPYMASGGRADPGSWNRYAYVGGDPVRFHDPAGLEQCDPEAEVSCYCVENPFAIGCDDRSYWPGGGGGGGSGSGGPHITSANPTQAQVKAVKQGFQDAYNRIYNSKCAELFNPFADFSPDSNPSLLGQIFAFQTLNSASYYIMPLAQGTGAMTSTDNTVFLNANGVFFNLQTNLDGSATVQLPDPTTGVNRGVTFNSIQELEGFILLHELGHETHVFGDDAGAAALIINGVHSQAVLDSCFTKNAKGQYQ